MEPEKFKLKDIGYGLVLPIIVAIIIIIFPAVLRPILDSAFPASGPNAFVTVIFTHGFAMMIMFGVPIVLGLVWNRWAGGAAGFITGTLYYLAYAGYFSVGITADMGAPYYPGGLYRDPSFIGDYIVGGIIIGYIAGALNNGSSSFKRMLGAGLTAAVAVGVFQYILNYTVAFGAWMTQSDPYFSLFTTMLPMIILGILAPIISKVMMWYGLQPMRHQ
ncbi:MAG: hypothetical protein ACE14S_09560 [Candidatus Bathyarchaeia archaeon]